jgi:hypothetical protein
MALVDSLLLFPVSPFFLPETDIIFHSPRDRLLLHTARFSRLIKKRIHNYQGCDSAGTVKKGMEISVSSSG